MIDLPTPLAVVCHDAGAANLILPWIAADRPEPLLPVMQGPAAALWRTRFGTTATLSVDEAVARASTVLTGTGWASNVEHRARRLARQRGIPSTAVIDHWVNYRERFQRGDEEVLPKEIWVTDDYALAMAEREFPDLPVRLKPNLYLNEQLASTPSLATEDKNVLIVAEPVRTDWGRGVPGEFQALDYLMERRNDIGIPADAHFRLRLHPAEPRDKYDQWVTRHPGVSIDQSEDLFAALGGARWVVGCESYALIVALHAGRQSISALPPWAPACRLPHGGIIKLARFEGPLSALEPQC